MTFNKIIDVKKLMKEKKNTTNAIDSPHAKYNAVGQLWCIICNRHIKSNILWNSHIQSRTHKENASQLKIEASNSKMHVVSLLPEVDSRKRKASDIDNLNVYDEQISKAKSTYSTEICMLQRNSLSLTLSNNEEMPDNDVSCFQQDSVSLLQDINVKLPSDFFDDFDDHTMQNTVTSLEPILPTTLANQLPEGFFDDPKIDAKVRQVPYKDKMEEEWELFQKTMKDEAIVSEALVEEDDEARKSERNIEEIDDQLNRWSRVTDLLKKRQKFTAEFINKKTCKDIYNSESESDDEFVAHCSNWRAGGK